jgi:hypothetical protein
MPQPLPVARLTACLLALAACAEPRPRSAKIETTIATALALDGEAVDAQAREELRASVTLAKRLEARESGSRWRFWERPSAAEAAWHESARLAWLHTRAVRARHADLVTTWEVERAQAADSLNEARALAARLGGFTAAASLQALEGAVLRADRFAGQGDFHRGVEILREHHTHGTRLRDAAEEANRRFYDPGLRRLWSEWVTKTLATSRKSSSPVVIVDKLQRRLEVYRRGAAIASYEAELGSGGLERKLYSGDKATPEGLYRVTEVRRPGATKYYRALMLDYPNADDRERFKKARRDGSVPPGVGIGSLIEIHGHGGKGKDWTDGCVALTNDDMDELVKLVGVGTPVTIVGTVP